MKGYAMTLSAAVMAALLLASCKPTEKNYKAAYDAALEKREAAMREQMIPTTGLMSDDGPQMRVVEGDTVYVLREALRRGEPSRKVGGWSVAVALYKMETNARANVENLVSEGYAPAFVARAGSEKWYAVVATVSTLDSARMVSSDFRRSHPGYPYVGLPKSPVILH